MRLYYDGHTTHLSHSSFIVFAIEIVISGVYPETAKCPCILPNAFDNILGLR